MYIFTTWHSLYNVYKCVMLFGGQSFVGVLLHSPRSTVIERGDTTWPVVVPSEPSQEVKE